MKTTETIVKTIKVKSGRLEIYSYQDGKKLQYANRIIANNGKLTSGNKGFNTVYGAMKNIKSDIKIKKQLDTLLSLKKI